MYRNKKMSLKYKRSCKCFIAMTRISKISIMLKYKTDNIKTSYSTSNKAVPLRPFAMANVSLVHNVWKHIGKQYLYKNTCKHP